MDTITEILTELEAMASVGVLDERRMRRAKNFVITYPEMFLEDQTAAMTVSEAADMAVELSYVK